MEQEFSLDSKYQLTMLNTYRSLQTMEPCYPPELHVDVLRASSYLLNDQGPGISFLAALGKYFQSTTFGSRNTLEHQFLLLRGS